MLAGLASLQVLAQLGRSGRMAQLSQRLGLDLADPLASDAEPLANLFEGALLTMECRLGSSS